MKFLNIPTEQIKNDLWDARSNAVTDGQTFDALVHDIEQNGLTNPIRVTKTENNRHYSIVAGRTRFVALKKLGYKEIPCTIDKKKSKIEYMIQSYSENKIRDNLTTIEEYKAISAIFQAAGYDNKEVMRIAKQVHNIKDCKDKRFAEIWKKTIKCEGNTLYQYIQIVEEIDNEALDLAQTLNFGFHKLNLLTHSLLRDHPVIQRDLVTAIAYATKDTAQITVAQAIRDLETGALKKTDKGTYLLHKDLREKIETKTKLEIPSQNYVDLTIAAKHFLRAFTGHQMTHGEYQYEHRHIANTKDHRLAILKGINVRSLITLENNLNLIKEIVDELLHEIDKESESREYKENLWRQ